ncbi:MAG: hypothetical protein KC621_32920, partial [Myxococcales bacterium]|nr:hypothetical protein [Myxococcales bacterium]
SLSTGAGVSGWSDGVSTVFQCSHVDTDVMSYALSVWDLDGVYADCLAWGYRPNEILSNPSADAGEPVDFPITGCVVGRFTR